jgi:ankyrin repeat protein
MSENPQDRSSFRDVKSAERIRRMIRPEALKKNEPLFWSPVPGVDVWEMFCAVITGDLETTRRLLDREPALARCAYEYRTPLSFAVRENQRKVAALLLERGADPVASGTPDTLLQIARDRGYDGMQKLLEGALAGPDEAAPAGASIAAAIRERDLASVRSLLDASPEFVRAVDERTNQPIDRAITFEQLRRTTRQRLGKPADSGNGNDILALADAQLLVARSHGFKNWAELAQHGG